MKKKQGKILAIDDNQDILFALKLLLKPEVEKLVTYQSPDKIAEAMASEEFDVILLDMNFSGEITSGEEGFSWLNEIIKTDPDAVVVFITAHGDTEKAVRAIKSGATDFVLKPWRNEKLLATINSCIRFRESKRENKRLKTHQQEISAVLDQPFHEFIGESVAMKKVFSLIRKVAPTDANVLILGENGTGKELVARSIYRQSARANEVFISVDLGSVSESLFESELFGFNKGAFTDAIRDKPGRFELADQGTLFLDELGNLSLPMQQKLLTVIEKGEVVRLGATIPAKIDVRLICATNSDIHELVEKMEFRQDLLYRINTVEINLPPLREREGDIEILANHFLTLYSKKYKRNITGISRTALKKLNAYQWPGNVRELQHAVERAVILSESELLKDDDFYFQPQKLSSNSYNDNQTLNLDSLEKNAVKTALDKSNGNISEAADLLGITRASLYRRIEKYDLEMP